MKKIIVTFVAVLALLFLVSCDANVISRTDKTVSVGLQPEGEDAVKTLTSSFTEFDKDTLYWKYTAVKNDSGSKAGQTTSETPVKTSGAPGLGVLESEFATGKWTFTLFAYTDSGYTKKAFTGSADAAFKGDKAVETVSVKVGPLSAGSGTLGLEKLEPESGAPASTTQSVTVQKIGGASTTYAETDVTFPKEISATSGIYYVTYMLSYKDGDDTFNTASETIQVVVYDNLTTTVSGTVDDITVHVNLDSDGPYTVTFDSNGGSAVGSQLVVNGGKVVKPGDPTKEGYNFGGWYKEAGCTNPWDFDNDTVTQDTTLYAQWTAMTYNITYKDHGGSEFSGTHESGYPTTHTYGTDTELSGASKSDYSFIGWYADSDCSGNKVDVLGATVYTDDITLYAKWEESSSCVVAGALITMADGTKRKVEDLRLNDVIRTYDFYTGSFQTRRIYAMEETLGSFRKILTLETSNGKKMKFANTQEFFDAEERAYFYINADNRGEVVGRKILTAGDEGLEVATITLIDVELEKVDYYDIVTEYDGNFIADDVLTLMPGGLASLLPFEIGEDFKVNAADMEEKISRYGLYDVESFPYEFSEELFEIHRAKYYKVLIGTGKLTWNFFEWCIQYGKENMELSYEF